MCITKAEGEGGFRRQLHAAGETGAERDAKAVETPANTCPVCVAAGVKATCCQIQRNRFVELEDEAWWSTAVSCF